VTIQTETSRSGPYAGSGTTGPFTVGFRFLDNSHLQVVKTSAAGVDTTLTLTTHYTVSGAGGNTGTVTLVTALAVGEQLTVVRNVPFTQLADYVDNDSFPAESHENALDLLTMQSQQLKDGFDRSLSLPVTASSGVSTELPAPQGNTLIGWSATGGALQNYNAADLGVSIAAASWVTQTFNGTGAQTSFVIASDPASASNIDLTVGGASQTADVNFSYTSATKTITFLTGAPAAGTGNVVARYGTALPAGTVGSTGITDSTATGRALLTAADAAAAGAIIGGGATGGGKDKAFYEGDTFITSSFTVGQSAQNSCTISIASPAVVTQSNTYVAGQQVRFTTTGALPTGLNTNAVYYVSATGLTTSSFQVSATSGGASVNTSGTQSGVQTCGKLKHAAMLTPAYFATGVVVSIPTGSRLVGL
jgi:hypothetical protein